MKDGRYANYKGKVYEYDRNPNGQYFLISDDKKELANGFEKEFENYYTKDVDKDDLECRFVVTTFCEFMGKRFELIDKKDDKVLIGTTNSKIYEDFKKSNIIMNEVGREEYEIWVNKSEVVDRQEIKNILDKEKKIKTLKCDISQALDTFDSVKPNKKNKPTKKRACTPLIASYNL